MRKRGVIFTIFLTVLLSGCKRDSGVKTEEQPEAPKWTITQYRDASDSQASFYTITSDKGSLILVDGGMEGNAEYVKQILTEQGEHVDAWILTHPHPDHIGAFNKLLAEGEVSVDAIYDNGLSYEVYQSIAEEWDQIECYETYLELTKDLTEVHSLQKDSVLSFNNLEIEFINSYHPGMEKHINDVPNNSSLAFIASAGEKSMLFTGDCYSSKLSEQWIAEYPDRLNVDYVQMGHHGNHTLPISFYEALTPKIVFFDAPHWLLSNDKYDTKENMDAIKKFADIIYDFSTSPNQVKLYTE